MPVQPNIEYYYANLRIEEKYKIKTTFMTKYAFNLYYKLSICQNRKYVL